MLLEALVITVCANGYDGCSQTTSAYYQQSKELQAISQKAERISEAIVKDHEWLVYVGSPLYAVINRRPAKFLIYKGTTFNVDVFNNSVGLQWNY